MGVILLFAHDTEMALLGAAALVNTNQFDKDSPLVGRDSLTDLSSLVGFLDEWHWNRSHQIDGADLEQLRALRPLVRRLWTLDETEVAATVNRMLRDANALPQLVMHDGWSYHLHATPPDAPLADRVTVDIAMAMVDVVRQGELSRLRECEARDCTSVLVDLSKNQSRRYCSTTCANRINVAAYRYRRSTGTDTLARGRSWSG